ncbi:MAG TPA: thioredoxin domain-containing protein, partial [Anaerolineae bacterium]|nr:thioredoxin domain-containing protein [Anaerolineae bacterium]
NGGFGGAPKFPNPADLMLLLRGGEKARRMALLTLKKMAAGGIYDQVGGGFCRYSVDDHWEIPHFEKMLYDNGQLLSLYSDAWLITGNPQFHAAIEQTGAWALREMRSEDGAFFSSLDADSEGEEGKFYVWQREELQQLLTKQEYALLEQHFGLGRPANFEHSWHLHAATDLDSALPKLGLTPQTADELWQSARTKLMEARSTRVRPGCDDKLLTSWNALMIAGLARTGRACGRLDWVEAAQAAVDFIRSRMWRDGQLLATCKDGHAHLNAYLDDHAFLLQALLELLQADFRAADLEFARDLAEALLDRFQDQEHGGFFFTSHDHEQLIQRPKSAHDNATPSGNGIAAHALQRLGHVLGEARYLAAAENTLRAFADTMQRNPASCPSLVLALSEYLVPPSVVVLRGPQPEIVQWKGTLDHQFLPETIVMALPDSASGLPQTLDRPLKNHVNAWLCRGVECLPAIESLDVLLERLQPLGNQAETRL